MMSVLPQYGRHLDPQQTMTAMVIDRYGGPDVLRAATVPRPLPRRRQVLVRNHFVGVNPKDVMVRKGKFKFATGSRFPRIIGHDIAGEVVAAGPAADLKPGDQVFGMINDFTGRAYAEYAAVDVGQLAKVPMGIDLRTAAAVPLAAQTALQALRDQAKIQPGDEVLINGASGGVGVFAVQIARILGARVTAVCSYRNVDMVRSLGAEQVIDYTAHDLEKLDQRFDTFFDVFGNYNFARVSPLLAEKGTYVQTIPSSAIIKDSVSSALGRRRAKLVLVKSSRSQLEWLGDQIDAGHMQVVVDRSFALQDVAAAHRLLETKRVRGKVVLVVD
jgi:NADPH:quinone reductase-like Zn-dependent oxidoreductase